MRPYALALKYFGIMYIILACGISILIYIYPSKFLAGTTLNEFVTFIGFCAFWLLGLPYVAYRMKYKPDYEALSNYTWIHYVILVTVTIYGIYCFAAPSEYDANGLTITPSIIEFGLAVLINLGCHVTITAQFILKDLEKSAVE